MNSWWSSIEIITKYSFILQILSISFLFFSLIFGAIGLKFSKRISDLQHTETIKTQEQDSLRTSVIGKLKTELYNTKGKLKSTKNELDKRITKTETAVKPRPLAERLRALLISIDPKIIPALKQGNTKFNGGLSVSQFNDLQKISKEVGANKYIIVNSEVKMGIGMGPEGVTYGVEFTLNPQLIKD